MVQKFSLCCCSSVLMDFVIYPRFNESREYSFRCHARDSFRVAEFRLTFAYLRHEPPTLSHTLTHNFFILLVRKQLLAGKFVWALAQHSLPRLKLWIEKVSHSRHGRLSPSRQISSFAVDAVFGAASDDKLKFIFYDKSSSLSPAATIFNAMTWWSLSSLFFFFRVWVWEMEDKWFWGLA